MTRPLLILLAALAHGCLSAQSAVADPYHDAALAAARKQGIKAAAVEKLTYAQTAALAGVKLGPKGESPASFHYEHVRRDVSRALAADEKATAETTRKAELEAKLRESFPTAEVAVRDDGTWEIKKLPAATVAVEAGAKGETGWAGPLGAVGGAGALAAAGVYAWRRRRTA